jgi:anti-sigma B factor antagonist
MDGTAPFEFTTEIVRQHEDVIVTPRGELDLSSADQFSAALEEAITGTTTIVIDLSETSFIDSSGLSVLVRVKQWLDIAGGSIRLRDPQEQAKMAIHAAGLASVLYIEP